MTMNDNIALESLRQDVSKYVKRVFLDPSKVKTIRIAAGKLDVVEGDYIDYMTDGRMLFNGNHQMLTTR